ncbi:glycosyltransferase family 2 protein [Mariniblastus sp.]|nr:glycosyltransferase family 2 protein [Mariniblastus sp.]
MLYSFFWILIGSMIALAGMQVLFIVYYRKIQQQSRLNDTKFADLSAPVPKVAIVLCLRGPDPTLPDCLAGVLKQRYSNFDLHLVVDSDDDPVIQIATSALQTIDSAIDVHWHTVANHSSDCSLKCSALITAVLSFETQTSTPDIVAFVDADALVAPDWLNRLVTPLLNSTNKASDESNAINVGATTGNRWFEPVDSNLGSQFRAAWNAAALPQMQIYQVAWGGSLAMKFETIKKCELLDRWSQAFCEDTMLADVLREHGLRVQRVPELIVVNQESTTLRSAISWISRQLLTVRLHHRAWLLILLHALVGGFCFYAPLVVAMIAVVENWPLAIWAVLGWSAQLGFNVGLLNLIRTITVRGIQQKNLKPASTQGILNKIMVGVVLQAIYPLLAIGAVFRQRVSWRGIDYRIGRKGQIEMVTYVPYSQVPQQNQHSIQ